jgi:hypothetical protein
VEVWLNLRVLGALKKEKAGFLENVMNALCLWPELECHQCMPWGNPRFLPSISSFYCERLMVTFSVPVMIQLWSVREAGHGEGEDKETNVI